METEARQKHKTERKHFRCQVIGSRHFVEVACLSKLMRNQSLFQMYTWSNNRQRHQEFLSMTIKTSDRRKLCMWLKIGIQDNEDDQ